MTVDITVSQLPRSQAIIAQLPAIRRFSLELEMRESGHLPEFTGSAVHGLFGLALRRLVCVTGLSDCEGCQLLPACWYTRLFASRTNDGRLAHAPQPLIFALQAEGPLRLEKGDKLSLYMTLLGEQRADLHFVWNAWQRAGQLGFGQRAGRFEVIRLQQEAKLGNNEWQTIGTSAGNQPVPLAAEYEIPEIPQKEVLAICLDTPLRIKRQGKLVGPHDFHLGHFLGALETRLIDLIQVHGEAPPPKRQPGHALLAHPEALVKANLQWRDYSRYSSRQKTRMQLGGLVGTLELDINILMAWWPLLWMGQWFGLGKQTSMGLGRYRVL